MPGEQNESQLMAGPCVSLQAEEAEAVYRAWISEAEARHQEREQTKGSTLRQIHDVIRHTDHTLRSVSQLTHLSGK